jgi:hypothetical protein
MTENPKYVDQFNNLVDSQNKEITFTTHAQIMKIENSDGCVLLGILMDRSVVIPLTANSETNDNIKNLVMTNMLDLEKECNESHAEAACRLLGLPFNGKTEGFFSDGNVIVKSTVGILHLYPEGFVKSQEDFLNKLTRMLENKNCSVSIDESP